MNRKFIAHGLVIDEAIVGIQLEDRISVPTQRTMTDGGQMHVPCRFARTGEQLYTAGQLGLKDKPANSVVRVLRDEADVFATDSMDTFRSAPVTIGHPKDADGKPIAVTAENSKELQVGMLEGMPVRDEDTLAGTLVITNQEAIDAIEDGTQELSAGYVCDIEEVDGKLYQRNIRANHIAIVKKGRAGSGCRISDEALEVRLEDDHPEPMRWDFMNDEAYENAMKCWRIAESVEFAGTKDAGGKASGNTGVADEETVKLVADLGLTVDEGATIETLIKLTTDELATVKGQLVTQKELTADFKQQAEEGQVKTKQLKVELADAKLAAKQDVLERAQVIEHARLIADMRIDDLAEMSTEQIKKLVVEDQNPEKDYSEKGVAFIDAMFEILVDASKGDTPMSKLLKKQESHVVVDAKPVDPVAQARANMIKRQASQSK